MSADYLLGRTEYIAPIEDMDRELMNQYTVSDIMNTIIELPLERRQDLVEYINLLKSSDAPKDMEQNEWEALSPTVLPSAPCKAAESATFEL